MIRLKPLGKFQRGLLLSQLIQDIPLLLGSGVPAPQERNRKLFSSVRFSLAISDVGCGLSETQAFLTSWSKQIFGYGKVSVGMTE